MSNFHNRFKNFDWNGANLPVEEKTQTEKITMLKYCNEIYVSQVADGSQGTIKFKSRADVIAFVDELYKLAEDMDGE